MEDSNNTSGSELWKLLPYHIKRESKILKFIDINVVEEETTYLIRFEERERSKDSNYILELPLTYFRIPEKTIEEYQIYLDNKAFVKRNKNVEKEIEKFEDIKKLLARVKEKEYFIEKKEFHEKITKMIQKIEKTPRYQELVQTYGLFKQPKKNLNDILLGTKSETIYEKIIWHFIFEKILNPSDSNLKKAEAFIENEINNKDRETKLKKIKIPEDIKEEISKVKIREHIEKPGNHEDIIRYPYSKKKFYLHQNTSFRWLWILYSILIPYYFFVSFYLLSNYLVVEDIIIWIIYSEIICISPDNFSSKFTSYYTSFKISYESS